MSRIYRNERRETENNKKQPSNASRHLCCLRNEKVKIYKGAAYHHDICYVKNKDTKTRNEKCDRKMLQELNGIYNSTLRERIERGVVSTIIGTKKRFGWGLKEQHN